MEDEQATTEIGDVALAAANASDDAARTRARTLGGCDGVPAPELDMLLGRGPRTVEEAWRRHSADCRVAGQPVPEYTRCPAEPGSCTVDWHNHPK